MDSFNYHLHDMYNCKKMFSIGDIMAIYQLMNKRRDVIAIEARVFISEILLQLFNSDTIFCR